VAPLYVRLLVLGEPLDDKFLDAVLQGSPRPGPGDPWHQPPSAAPARRGRQRTAARPADDAGPGPAARAAALTPSVVPRAAGARRRGEFHAGGRTMSESIDDTPVPDDDVEEVLADEEDPEEAARSLPEIGSDDDPGSMINH
jgi:hypothetical protein